MGFTVPSDGATGELIDAAKWNTVADAIQFLATLTAGGTALSALAAAREIGLTVGMIQWAIFPDDLGNRWLRCDGRTIGNDSSGASARANNDMLNLFTTIWTYIPAVNAGMFDSLGNPVSRGGTASADWAANRQLALPDMRGRVIAGMDDPTGASAANFVTDPASDTMAGRYGAESGTVTENHLPANMVKNKVGTGLGAGSGVFDVGTVGIGAPLTLLNPAIALNAFIYTGN